MTLYIFRCRERPKKYGATRFETASNLPTDRCSGGWKFSERVELAVRGTLRFAVDTGTLRRQVQKNGWYVWDESPSDSLRSEPESKPLFRAQQRPPAEPETATMKVPGLPMTTMVPPTAAKVVPAPPVVPATNGLWPVCVSPDMLQRWPGILTFIYNRSKRTQ